MSRFFHRRPTGPELATLLELFDGDRNGVLSLLQAALSSMSSDVEIIERSVNADERRTIIAATHRLKGTSGTIGAGALIELSTLIESTVSANGDVAPALLSELRQAVANVALEIKAFAGTA